MGREGTWSRNASVPLQPATSYHRASTDRWMQESPIIEMLRHKRSNEREEFLHARRCVRMVRGSQGSAASATATHLRHWRKHEAPTKDLREAWFISARLVDFLVTQSQLQYGYHGNLYLESRLIFQDPRRLILPIYPVSFTALVLCF